MPWIDDEIQSIFWNNATHTHIFISIYPSYDALAGTFVCGLSKVDQHPGQGKRQWNGGRRWFQGFFIVLPDHSIWLLFQRGFETTGWLWKSRAVISAGVHFRSRDASRMMIYHNYLQYFLYNNMMYIYQYIYIYIHTLNDLFPTDSELLCSQTFLNPQAAYQKIANPCPRVKAQQICQTNGKCM